MSAHTYWRIRYKYPDGSNIQYAEVYFLDSSGTDLCTGGTVIYSSQYNTPTFAAVNAFDRNHSTNYAALNNVGQWIGYQFASPVDVAKVGVRGSTTGPSENSKGILIERSDDGTNWRCVTSIDDGAGNLTAGEYREYTVAAQDRNFDLDPHRYWRIRPFSLSTANVSQWIVGEIVFRDTSDTDLTVVEGGSTIELNHDSTWFASLAFDRVDSFGWQKDFPTLDSWVGWDFGAGNEQAVAKIDLRAGSGYGAFMPTSYWVEYSDDATTWVIREEINNNTPYTSSEWRYYTFATEPEVTEISKDFTFDYKVLLYDLNTFDYKIKLGKNITFDYEINALISKVVDFEYKIAMHKLIDFDYKIKLFADYDFDFQVIRTFQANFPFDYKIELTKPFEFDYRVKLYVDFDFDYEVIVTFGKSFTFTYNIELYKLVNFDYRIKLHANFTFDYEIINTVVPVTGPYTWRLPEVPITETWEYNTKISTSRSGLEQRATLRNHPRVSFQHRHIILTDDDFRTFQDELLTQLTGDIRIPQHSQTVAAKAPTSYGDTNVYCKMTATDIRVGDLVAFFDIGSEEAYLRLVSAVSTNYFTISEPYPFTDHRGVAITPTRLMRFADGSANKMRTVWGDNDLTFVDATSRALIRPSAPADLVAEFDGYPIITLRPLANESIADAYNAGFKTIDFSERLPPAVVRNWHGVAVTRSYTWSFRRGSTLDYWRELADTTRGSWRAFLMPTFRPDLEPVSSVGALVTVAGNMLESVLILGGYKHLMVTTNSGVSFYRIDGVVIAGENTQLTLSGSVSGTIEEISFVNLVRVSDDVFTFAHNDMYSELTLNLRVVHQ